MATDAEQAREIDLLDIANIMSTKGGRKFMWRNLELSGIFADNFDDDPYRHAHNAGQRSRGLWLQSELMEAAIGSYSTMVEENSNG